MKKFFKWIDKGIIIGIIFPVIAVIINSFFTIFDPLSLFAGIIGTAIVFMGLFIFVRWMAMDDVTKATAQVVKTEMEIIINNAVQLAMEKQRAQMHLVTDDEMQKWEERGEIHGKKILEITIIDDNFEYDKDGAFIETETNNIKKGMKYIHYIKDTVKNLDYLKRLREKSGKPVNYAYVDSDNVLYSEDTQFVLYFHELKIPFIDQNNEESYHNEIGVEGYMLCPGLFSDTEDESCHNYSVRLSDAMVNGIRTKIKNCEILQL